MNSQHARDTCKAALLVREHLLRAANDRVCRQADHFGDLNYLLINLAHAGPLLRRRSEAAATDRPALGRPAPRP